MLRLVALLLVLSLVRSEIVTMRAADGLSIMVNTESGSYVVVVDGNDWTGFGADINTTSTIALPTFNDTFSSTDKVHTMPP